MQAGTYFPKVKRMLLCLNLSNSIHFWPASTLLRGHLALATPSPPETHPQILERWGHAHEVHLGKYIQAKDFGSRMSAVFVNGTHWTGFRMSEYFRKIDGVAPYPETRNPTVVKNMSGHSQQVALTSLHHCVFVTKLFVNPLVWRFFTV